MAATGGQGSSHHYSPVFGWAKAYPETTGYLIPTLLRYADLLQDDSLRALALDCRAWLLRLQLPSGAWAGGVVGGTSPSVFNTAMILCGIGYPRTPFGAPVPNGVRQYDASTEAAERGLSWLLASLSPDGAWRGGLYVPGFVPTYHTYALWSVLEAEQALHRPDVSEKMRTALRFHAERFRPDGTVADWGLKPGEWAFTHTIAYTLQGFLESALLLHEPDILEKTVHAATGLLTEMERTKHIAGRYGTGWRGDYSFTCPVGNAQLSILYRRIGHITGEPRFTKAADFCLAETLRFQNHGKNPNTHGALPGSVPFWGPYMRWRYPNWGVKFLLDAMLSPCPPAATPTTSTMRPENQAPQKTRRPAQRGRTRQTQ